MTVTYAEQVRHRDGETDDERAAGLHLGSFLVDVREDGEGEEEREQRLHEASLKRRQLRVQSRHAVVRPDQVFRRQRLHEEDAKVSAGALRDRVPDSPHDADMSGQHDRYTDGRVDVATARRHGSPHDDGDAEPGAHARLHQARVFPVERSRETSDDAEQKARGEELDGEISVEEASLQLAEAGGVRQLIHHRVVVAWRWSAGR